MGWLGPSAGRWRRAALALLCGAGLNLAQPPVFFWPALFVLWPILALLAARAERPARAALFGFAAGLGFFGAGTYWIGESFLIEAARHWWLAPLAPLAIGALATLLAGFWAAAFWLARRAGARGWRLPLALGLAMLALEVARGWALTGFPWALQSYALIDAPPGQLGAVTGFYALSGLLIAAAASPAAGRAGPPLLAALALSAGWWWGAERLAAPTGAEGPVIRLIQPNTRQIDKWKPENRESNFTNLLDLTRAAPRGEAPVLVVWPESAVTFLLDRSPDARARILDAAGGASVAIGSVRLERSGYYNSLFGYATDGAPFMRYDKRHLAPFGEYVPYAWVLGRIGLGVLGEGLKGYQPGRSASLFTPPGLPPVSPLICYDAVFPGETRAAAKGARWLLHVTNDSWFGDSAGPRQHLAIARARAIELGLPVARAANTGVSAMIDGRGRLRAALALDQRGLIDSPLPPVSGAPTPYARHGDVMVINLTAISLGLPLLFHAFFTRMQRNNR